ncbi:major facilitator superfamily domain-containing protein [Lipomyces orientalis]|uniref:Major facilitator superfamily domain-containing protein n=1 Tax=Lipomyces orientalis TaxID=1233043 RepID=A0ACC3TM11_9ASCO
MSSSDIIEEEAEATQLLTTEERKIADEEALVDELEVEELERGRLIVVFLSLYVGVFLAAIDGTIVATLLSRIASDFNEFRSVSWIATGYLIAQAAFQPTYGKLSDIFGRKPVLLVCNAFFGVGSILCGLAPTLWFLVFARVIAGMGGGGLTTLSAITLSDIVPLRQRGLLQGIGNILYACGAATGGILGGILTETVGWRWTFAMQGPIIFVSVLAIQFNLNLPSKEYDGSKFKRIDFLGSFTLVTGLCLFLFGVSVGGSYFPWRSPFVSLPLSLSFIVLASFVYVELYIANEPVIPLGLLKNRTVAGSAFTSWFTTMVYFSNIFYTAIYMIAVQGASPSKSGSSLMPQFIGSALGSLVCGYYMRMTGRYRPMSVLAMITLFGGSLLLCTIGIDSNLNVVSTYLFLPGFGGGVYLTITLVGLIAAVPHEYQAVSTSIQYGFRGTGATIGVAVAASIFQNTLGKQLHERVIGPGSEEVIRLVQDSVEEIASVPEPFRLAVTLSYLDAVHAVLYTSAFLAFCAGVSSLTMKEHVLHSNMSRR